MSEIKGIVRDRVTNQPVPSLRVQVIGTGVGGSETLGSAITDSDGTFRVSFDQNKGPGNRNLCAASTPSETPILNVTQEIVPCLM